MSQLRELTISVRLLGHATIVDLEGRIALTNSTPLRSTLFDALPAATRLAVNMTGINYVDSSGLATLLEVLKKARDLHKDFVLFGLSPKVYDVLKLTHLLGIFQIFDSEEHALKGNTGS